jgi:hypothetical protein
LSHDIETIHVGQTKIEDDKICGFSTNKVERRAPVGGGCDGIAPAFQARAQKTKDRRLVIDDKNAKPARLWRHGRASAGNLGKTGIGRRVVKPAPGRSVRFLAVIEPPVASMKPREIAKPAGIAGVVCCLRLSAAPNPSTTVFTQFDDIFP